MTDELRAKRVPSTAIVLAVCGAMLTGCGAHTHHATESKDQGKQQRALSARAYALRKAQAERQAELAARAATLLQKATSIRPWPFVPIGGMTAGRVGAGDGPSTPTGDHLRCRPGRHYAQVVRLRNRSGAEVTLLGARLDSASVRVIRRVAVQFRLRASAADRRSVGRGAAVMEQL